MGTSVPIPSKNDANGCCQRPNSLYNPNFFIQPTQCRGTTFTNATRTAAQPTYTYCRLTHPAAACARPQAEPCHHPARAKLCATSPAEPRHPSARVPRAACHSSSPGACHWPPAPSSEPCATLCHFLQQRTRNLIVIVWGMSCLLKCSAVCVTPRRSLCRAPALSVIAGPGALCVAALPVSGPDGLCIRARCLLCRFSALCVGRRFLCQGPALSVWGPGAPRRSLCRVRRSVCLHRAPKLSVSGRSALRVGLRGGVCWAPALHHMQPTNVYSIAGMHVSWRSKLRIKTLNISSESY